MTEKSKKRKASAGQSIGGLIVGFDQQVFRTTPPVKELVAKGDRLRTVAAAGGGTMRIGMPGDPAEPEPDIAESEPEPEPDIAESDLGPDTTDSAESEPLRNETPA